MYTARQGRDLVFVGLWRALDPYAEVSSRTDA